MSFLIIENLLMLRSCRNSTKWFICRYKHATVLLSIEWISNKFSAVYVKDKVEWNAATSPTNPWKLQFLTILEREFHKNR